jgi:hypothetical protein
MMKAETVELQNLYQAAYLLCLGFKVTGIRKDNYKSTITFEGNGVEREALNFYNESMVNAKEYSDAYRGLKDMVFQR